VIMMVLNVMGIMKVMIMVMSMVMIMVMQI
jgi:hypothetical protein